MTGEYNIEDRTVHLWRAFIPKLVTEENALKTVLNEEELQRANRLRFLEHRSRFIIAHGILRKILSFYLNRPPQDIHFIQGERGKPFIQDNPLNLQFNLSHSEDAILIGLTIAHPIGVDIQKMDDKYHEALVKRFFNHEEFLQLHQAPLHERPLIFYRLWVAKEALIKAMGEGLYVSLGDFFVDFQQDEQWVTIEHENKPSRFYLKNFITYAAYQSAFAVKQEKSVKKIVYWEWGADLQHRL